MQKMHNCDENDSQQSAVIVALVLQLVAKIVHFQTTQSSSVKSHALCFNSCDDTQVLGQAPNI